MTGNWETLQAFPAWGRGTASAALGCFRKQHKCASLFPVLPICLSCHSHPIRPCGAPSPRGEGFDTRIPSSKKGGEADSIQQSSLHFGRDDRWKTDSLTSSFTPLRGSILHLWRAPSLRGYSYRNITPLVPKHATYLPDESPSALAYRHPERTKTLYV